MENAPTPRPWFVNGPGHIQGPTPIIGTRKNGEAIRDNPHIIAQLCPMDNSEANGDFLVRAVNAYEPMREALENLENDAGTIPDTIWAMVQDALKLAEGGEK